jgi:hypothetical protein
MGDDLATLLLDGDHPVGAHRLDLPLAGEPRVGSGGLGDREQREYQKQSVAHQTPPHRNVRFRL